jgi:hypothetical protein
MKVLLFLNGFDGSQTGIEDGFQFILNSGKITELEWFYFEDFANKKSTKASLDKMLFLAKDFNPNLIIFFHIGNFPISINFLNELRNIKSLHQIVYDEGDMYGSWAKPLNKRIKILMKFSNAVSIRGLGSFEILVRKYNKNVFFTPQNNDIARFMNEPFEFPKKRKDIIFIGNRLKSRLLGNLRRLPGSKEREDFVKYMINNFPSDFKLYGNGWGGFKLYNGPVEFYSQNEYYRNSLITVSYEHYPKIPLFFSNRLSIALMNGSLCVCHEHEGYKDLFPENDFIFFFKNHTEAKLIIDKIMKFEEDEYNNRSKRAREFALNHFHPNVVWSNFLLNILKDGN